MNKEMDEIYRLYAEDVYRFIYRLSRNEAVSCDILQDTMLKAVTNYSSFKGNCSVKTWLCTIARNEYYNYLKRAENNNSPLDDKLAESSFEEKLMDSAQAVSIHKMIHKLDEPYKEVFSLRVFAELRTCPHRVNVRIFRHNFVGGKAKIRRRAVALQGFLTRQPAKFDEKTCMNPYVDRFLNSRTLAQYSASPKTGQESRFSEQKKRL